MADFQSKIDKFVDSLAGEETDAERRLRLQRAIGAPSEEVRSVERVKGPKLGNNESRLENPKQVLREPLDMEAIAPKQVIPEELIQQKMQMARDAQAQSPLVDSKRNRAPASVMEQPMDPMQKLDMYLQKNPQRIADLENNPQLKQAFDLYKRSQAK